MSHKEQKSQTPSKGQWQLQRERFQLDENSAPLPPDRGQSISDIVPNVMRQMGLSDRFWEQALINEWPALVGEQVARHARPGRLERKILHIFVAHPTWLSELSRYGQKQLLQNLQRRFGADRIRSVRLQLDPEKR